VRGALEPWTPPQRDPEWSRVPSLTLQPIEWLLAPAGLQTPGGGSLAQDFRGTLKAFGVDKAPPFDRQAPELLRWKEEFRHIEAAFVVDTPARVWELWRVPVGDGEVLTIERASTYLQLTQGQGAPFFVTGPLTDPLASLVGPAGEVLSARWILDVTETTQPVRPLVNAPVGSLPQGGPLVGLPRAWSDLRYAHGTRYTEARQHVVTGPANVRFFVELSFIGDGAGGPGITVRAGSLVSGWKVAGSGPTRAALVAMTRRL